MKFMLRYFVKYVNDYRVIEQLVFIQLYKKLFFLNYCLNV